jgi:LytS/YehU family sensor histidine kinase
MVYFHLYVLVPKLLERKKYFLYTVVVLVMVYGYSWLNYTLQRELPTAGMPDMMFRFIHQRITPDFDFLEGLIVLLLTYALKYTLIAFITQNELLQVQKEKLQLELNALKAQIHPHFLFNTLNNLYSLTLKNSEKSSEVVLKLSDIMRYVLYEANEDEVDLKKEIAFSKNYITLQRLRYSEQYKILFSVEGEVEGIKVAPLLFIDFIENAFKHGLEKRYNDGTVEVTFQISKNEIHFKVVNSKSESDTPDPRGQANGIGLANIRKRLSLIYPGAYDLKISESEELFEVNLNLQLK